MKSETQDALVRILPVIPIIALALAIQDNNSHSYYVFLRFLVCGFFGYWTIFLVRIEKEGWSWIFGMTALLYNPVLKVELDRDYWMSINIITVILCFVSGAILYRWSEFWDHLKNFGKTSFRELWKDTETFLIVVAVFLVGLCYGGFSIWKITPPGKQWAEERQENRSKRVVEEFKRRAHDLKWNEYTFEGDFREGGFSLKLVDFMAENFSTEELQKINKDFRADLGVELKNWESELLPRARKLGYRGY